MLNGAKTVISFGSVPVPPVRFLVPVPPVLVLTGAGSRLLVGTAAFLKNPEKITKRIFCDFGISYVFLEKFS